MDSHRLVEDPSPPPSVVRWIAYVEVPGVRLEVETARNPSLRDHPLVLGGLPHEEGAVVEVSPQLRARDVGPGLPLSEAATRAPRALFLPAQPRFYVHVARQLLSDLRHRVEAVEWYALGAFYVDLGLMASRDVRGRCDALSAIVRNRHRLPVRIGAGPNRRVARMASRLARASEPVILSLREFREAVASRPVEWLEDEIESRPLQSLRALGVVTVADLAQTDPRTLTPYFGAAAHRWIQRARGIDQSRVIAFDPARPRFDVVHSRSPEESSGASDRTPSPVDAVREARPETREGGRIDRVIREAASLLEAGWTRRTAEDARSTTDPVFDLFVEWNDFSVTGGRQPMGPGGRIDAGALRRAALRLFHRFDTGGYVRRVRLVLEPVRLPAPAAVRSSSTTPTTEPTRRIAPGPGTGAPTRDTGASTPDAGSPTREAGEAGAEAALLRGETST